MKTLFGACRWPEAGGLVEDRAAFPVPINHLLKVGGHSATAFGVLEAEGQVPFLAVLRHEEGIRLNPDPLVALYSDLGEGAAERVLCRALDDLGGKLSDILRHADVGRGPLVARSARHLCEAAEQIGMATLARVAEDVLRTTEAGDHAGQAATLARLVRIVERSVCAIWDLRAMTC